MGVKNLLSISNTVKNVTSEWLRAKFQKLSDRSNTEGGLYLIYSIPSTYCIYQVPSLWLSPVHTCTCCLLFTSIPNLLISHIRALIITRHFPILLYLTPDALQLSLTQHGISQLHNSFESFVTITWFAVSTTAIEGFTLSDVSGFSLLTWATGASLSLSPLPSHPYTYHYPATLLHSSHD